MHRCVPTLALALAASIAVGTTARAQCTTFWLPGDPRQGPDGPVKALTMWDPDGAGPLAARLVVGGQFVAAVAALLPTAGSVATQLAIPNQPALIGQVFHHQVVPVELAPTGGLLAVTSTNRLTALIGSF